MYNRITATDKNLFQKEKKKFYFEICTWNLYVIREDSSHYIIDGLGCLRRASHLHLNCVFLVVSFLLLSTCCFLSSIPSSPLGNRPQLHLHKSRCSMESPAGETFSRRSHWLQSFLLLRGVRE